MKHARIRIHALPLLGALTLLGGTATHAQTKETIGGGTVTTPAVGPAPSYGIGGPGMVLVKNWHFGTGGTIKNQAEMNANFQYHDQFGTFNNGNGEYGANIVAPDAANAINNQPVEGVDSPPVRQFTADSLKTLLTGLDGATLVDPNKHNAGNGSFMAKWKLPNGGLLLGRDIVWETRVRYVTPPYFWFGLWVAGNKWKWNGQAQGAEMDLCESFGFDNGGGPQNTNYDGRFWHSNTVASPSKDTIDYTHGWTSAMVNAGFAKFDATQYHIWTWVYKRDNTFTVYCDGKKVQSGSNYYWTFGNTAQDEPIDVDFLFDGSWGHTKVGSVDHPLPVSAFDGKFYEWNYSRVYLSGASETVFHGPHAIPGTLQSADYDTGGEGVGYHSVSPHDVSPHDASVRVGQHYRPDGAILEAGSDTGGGSAVSRASAGGYLSFIVTPVSPLGTGNYTTAIRVASLTGGTFHFQDAGGANISGPITVPKTGGRRKWATVTAKITLPSGLQILRLCEDTGSYSLGAMTFRVPQSTARASFQKLDPKTQGNWKGNYGADGHNISLDSASLPAYVSTGPALSNSPGSYQWAGPTADIRALQKGTGTDRIAAQWYGNPSFNLDCNLTDGKAHQVSVYALDWDTHGPRAETIQVLDAGSGAVLDSRPLSSFISGTYCVWSVQGHVLIHVINTAGDGSNASLSGLFFDPLPGQLKPKAAASANSLLNANNLLKEK